MDTTKYHIPWAAGTDRANGSPSLQSIATAIDTGLSNTLVESTVQQFDPVWSASVGNGTKVGYYSVRNGRCTLSINLIFGSTANGGTDPLSVNLPVLPSLLLEQELTCKLLVPGVGNLLGFMAIAPGIAVGSLEWLNSDVKSGGNFTCSGIYFTA
jgi:hypothetical protein